MTQFLSLAKPGCMIRFELWLRWLKPRRDGTEGDNLKRGLGTGLT